MQLQIKGKNLEVSDSVRSYAERKLSKLDRVMHDDARVEIELAAERNPSVAHNQVAEAPGLEGDAARFVALPDGSLLVEDGPDDGLEPLAAAVEQALPAPYRARAARQRETMWAVQARRIEVIELRDDLGGDTIDVTH